MSDRKKNKPIWMCEKQLIDIKIELLRETLAELQNWNSEKYYDVIEDKIEDLRANRPI